MIGVAYCYLRKYYSDDSFDNFRINENIESLWKECPGQWPDLTPLRNWELREKYQIRGSICLSWKDWKGVMIRAVPTLVMALTAYWILFADYA